MEQKNNKLETMLSIVRFSVDHPKTLTWIMVVLAIVFAAMIPWIQVDTDPENMLDEHEPVRLFHDNMKEEFTLYDMVVVGVVNEEHEDGVFTPETLSRVYELTQFAETELHWPDPKNPDKSIGVVSIDLLAPSKVDNIEQAGLGSVKFEYLMKEPPTTREEAISIRDNALNNPLLKGTMVSEDGQALCLYLPLTSKDLSYRVYSALQEKITEFEGPEQYYITGLPVAEDTFGVQMFIQMAISAPLAMLVIFLLMLFFFRKLSMIISPMIVAMASVIYTMGLLIGTGNTVHIMSSMIPIFIMPIAVLDSIHIISDFFDKYPKNRDRRKTIMEVMRHLFVPMLYTSLTSAAGFASLALAPIPPVQVFGIFVAFGVMTAWLLTITFIPAYTMFIKEESLQNFGMKESEGTKATGLSALMHAVGNFSYHKSKFVVVAAVFLTGLAFYGISQIQINDNPVKWFTEDHPIRVADRVMNKHLGGTYMAYLALEEEEKPFSEEAKALIGNIEETIDKTKEEFKEDIPEIVDAAQKAKGLLTPYKNNTPESLIKFEESLIEDIDGQAEKAEGWSIDAWDEIRAAVQRVFLAQQTFKRPDVLRYMEKMQKDFLKTGIVGKSNSVTDIVKKIHMELFEGKEEKFTVPDSPAAVAQCLISYQNSHNPDDLWHFVTPDYQKASMWLQLNSGDNKDMEAVVASLDSYMQQNPPPVSLQANWFGLTYINVVWQDKMVTGMLEAFLGSFLIVFLMMTILFSSPLWGLLSMIPLTVTIALIYGMIGLVGKDYDMPVAVLSSLTLGMAIDFAIHFMARSRELVNAHGSWQKAIPFVFGEPARAISRNLVVIAVGFLPLLAAPLVPYKTVGIFIATILAVSGVGTLVLLPALVTVMDKWLYKPGAEKGFTCNCAVCIVSSILAVLLIALNLGEFLDVGWTTLTWVSLILIPVFASICGMLSRRGVCKIEDEPKETIAEEEK